MYAVVELGGKQHRVSVGEKVLIDLQAKKKVGDTLQFNNVMVLGGEAYKIGKPYIAGAMVLGKVSSMGHDPERVGVKGPKIRVFKKKRRKGFQKTIGHRERFTEVLIEDIKG